MSKYEGMFPIHKKKKSKPKNRIKTKSIVQLDKECYFKDKIPHACDCGIEEHHCFEGNPNRKHSEEDGLKIYSCPCMHRGRYGIHQNREVELLVKKHAQMVYESEIGTREEFIIRYGKSYL